MSRVKSVHEAGAELLSAEDAIQDAERLRDWFRRRQHAERVVSVRLPLWALLDVIDHLSPEELREVARRAEERLVPSES